jgi:V/A-type H+-transporting ATPase subunit I
MRPHRASWFELLTSREELGGVLQCLARSGIVELETYSDISQPEWLPEMQEVLQQFKTLSDRYQQYWPEPAPAPDHHQRTDSDSGKQVMRSLLEWSALAEPLVVESQQLGAELELLQLLRQWLENVPPDALPNMGLLHAAGPVIGVRLYVLPAGAWPETASPSLMLHKTESSRHNFLLVLGRKAQVEVLDQSVQGLKGRVVPLPEWLPHNLSEALSGIQARAHNIELQKQKISESIATLSRDHELPTLLAQMRFLIWVVEQVPQLSMTEHFAWVTGWTSDLEGSALRARLDKCGQSYLIRFPPAPARSQSPIILRNPAWAKPFEVFAGLLGTPSAGEADPSPLVAFIAPLMFGFMFGDVGQGAVLLSLGLLLKGRYPALKLLVPGGLMAMLFGLLFGSVFANENLLPALWLHPINSPLPVLAVSLAIGATVISLGITLDALQSHWAGLGGQWWQRRAGLAFSYAGALAATQWIDMIWVVLAGMLWFVIGNGLAGEGDKLQSAGSALAEFAETMLQLLVNTVSFVRVGAFALAHSGLSMAVAGIAEAFDSLAASIAIFVVGNLFVLTLEALVVGIQATRLVLFEFFIRFLRAEGRAFHPLTTPDHPSDKNLRSAS